MEMERILLLLNLAEKLRGLPALGNLLQLVTTEIAQIEAQAKDEVALQAEAAKKEAQAQAPAPVEEPKEQEKPADEKKEATNERRA